MLPTLPPVVLVLELLCGSVRALVSNGVGSIMSHAVWLIAASLPAACWAAERLVASSWDNFRSGDDGL